MKEQKVSLKEILARLTYELDFIKNILKENLQRDREKEKNLRKKRIFSGKKSLLKKFSFPRENSLS